MNLYKIVPPPYKVCTNTENYTKDQIIEFKKKLENIETELEKLTISSNDPRKPKLRRQAADLEEIIIEYEKSKKTPEIIDLLNNHIKFLSEYVELEQNNIIDKEEKTSDDIINKLTTNLFIEDTNSPIRNLDILTQPMSESDIPLFKEFLKKKFPRYKNAFEKYISNISKEMFKSNLQTPKNLLHSLRYNLETGRNKAIKRRKEINLFIDETQLNFYKKLSIFIVNIISEKKNLEDKLIKLETKLDNQEKIINNFIMNTTR